MSKARYLYCQMNNISQCFQVSEVLRQKQMASYFLSCLKQSLWNNWCLCVINFSLFLQDNVTSKIFISKDFLSKFKILVYLVAYRNNSFVQSFFLKFSRFILANCSAPRRLSSGVSSSSSDDSNHLHPAEVFTPHRRGSWRQAIFNRVVTPAKHPTTPTLDGMNCFDTEFMLSLFNSTAAPLL